MNIPVFIAENWNLIEIGFAGLAGGVLGCLMERTKAPRDVLFTLVGGVCGAVYLGDAICFWFGLHYKLCLLLDFAIGIYSLVIYDGTKKVLVKAFFILIKNLEALFKYFTRGSNNGNNQSPPT